MERQRSLLSTLLFIIIIFMMLASALDVPPVIALGGLMLLIIVITVAYLGQMRPPRSPEGPRRPPLEPEIPAFRVGAPRLGRWVIIPIALASFVGFIAFENWWLGVTILISMYSRKASIDWWSISYLNNNYFYALIAVGILVAISDPRIVIVKGVDGRRRFYINSKFWALVNAIRSQLYSFQPFSPFIATLTREPVSGLIPLRRGLLWRLTEFAGASLLVAPNFAKAWTLQFMIIANWVKSEGITWLGLLQRAGSLLYSRLVLAEKPTGEWLIENSPILEFLQWLRIPIMLIGAVWGVRLFISFILEVRRGFMFKAIRNLALIGCIILVPTIIQTPTQAFDVSTPYYLRTMLLGEVILIALSAFLSLRDYLLQAAVASIFRRRIILALIVILTSSSLLYGPVAVAVQVTPAIEGHWKEYLWIPKYLPNVEYTRWATGIEPIIEGNIHSAMDTGENLRILSSVRAFNREAAVLRMKPAIGVNWMDLTEPDIVSVRGNEYWVSALKIVQPPGADPWRSSRLLLTHSERILAIDASDGKIITDAAKVIFNITDPVAIYYGEGGLFAASDMVYIGVPGFAETHLPEYTGPPAYAGEPDYVLTGFERLWFFSGIFGQEQLRWDFGRGDFGDIKMLYLRDVSKRLKQILLPDMKLDEDPYLVSDGKNIYYCFYVYVERDMPTDYLDYPTRRFKFWRIFATVLVNSYDGRITGFLLNTGERDYILDFYRNMYPQWSGRIPEWLLPQLRYPEFLFGKQIAVYNVYHVSDPDKWQKNTDFFQLTTDATGRVIEEVRYVTFSFDKRELWAGVRLVEAFQAPGKNLAGIYVALNGEDFGKIFFLRAGNVALIGPQTALDVINNYGPTKFQLTTHTNPPWVPGNILLYVVNGTAYYFIPYYASSPTTLAPAMMVVVDAMHQRVGYHVISNPQDVAEVAASVEKAYVNLVGTRVESIAEIRKANILNLFRALNYSIRIPRQLSPNVAFIVDEVDYLSEGDILEVREAVEGFVKSYLDPYGLSHVLMWETNVEGRRILNFGALVNELGVVCLYYITVTYYTG